VEITTVEKRYYLGVIVSEDANSIIVRDSQGIKTQIEKSKIVERLGLQDPNDRRRELESLFDTRLEAVEKTDLKGYYELGQWAKQRGMKKQAEQAFREVLRIDAAHNGAGQELGWKLVNGKYVDPAAPTPTETTAADINDILMHYDPTATSGTDTGGQIDDPAVKLAKDDPKFRAGLYKILKSQPQGEAAQAQRRKAIVLIGKSRRFDLITGVLEVLLSDRDPATVKAAAESLKAMKYDRMATVLADLAALNQTAFYRDRAIYGLAILSDNSGIDRLLFHAGFQVAGGTPGDAHNPLIDVGSDQLDPSTYLSAVAPKTGSTNPQDQTPQYPALAAIRRLSGKDFKTDLTNWRLWWAGAARDFKFIVPEVK
jgi:hypothetical protein